MEVICWNIVKDGYGPDLNPIKQIWGELENKLDRSTVLLKESLWLEVLRKYTGTMPERCAVFITAKD